MIATNFPEMYAIYQLFEKKRQELTKQEAQLIQKNVTEIDQKLKGEVIQNRKQYGEQIKTLKDKQNMVEEEMKKTHEQMRKQSIGCIKMSFESKYIKIKEEFERQQIDFYQSQLQKLRKQKKPAQQSIKKEKTNTVHHSSIIPFTNQLIVPQKMEKVSENLISSDLTDSFSNNYVSSQIIDTTRFNSPKNGNIGFSSRLIVNAVSFLFCSSYLTVFKQIFCVSLNKCKDIF